MDPIVLAAVIAFLAPFFYAMWVRLGHINGAVNNKEKDEPTLREVALDVREVALATAEQISTLRGLLEAHSKADAENFEALRSEQRKATERIVESSSTNTDRIVASANKINEGNQP